MSRRTTRAAPERPEPWRTPLYAAALAALCILAFWPSVHGGFIWDDLQFIIHNPLMQTGRGLGEIWLGDTNEDYWPISYSLFWIEWHLWGAQPFGYHVVNILLHCGATIMAWQLLLALRCPRGSAWLAAALFAVHPVNAEAVAWIFQTKTTLCALFAFASLSCFLAFARSGKRAVYLASLFLFLLSLLAKLASLFLPLLGAGWLLNAPRGERWRRVAALMPFGLVALAMGVHGLWYRSKRLTFEERLFDGAFAWGDRLLTAARSVWFYLQKAYFPTDLSFVYPRWKEHGDYGVKLAAAMALTAMLILCVRGKTTLSRISLAALFFLLVMLLPCLGLHDFSFMRYSFVADHYLYLGLIAPLAWGVLTARALARAWTLRHRVVFLETARQRKVAFRVFFVSLLIAAVFASRGRTEAFRDEETLWRDTLTKNPAAILAHNNLAVIQEGRGERAAALEHYEEILRLTRADCPSLPLCAGAHFNVGRLYATAGRSAEAIAHYQQAVALHPSLAEAHYNLAMLLDEAGRYPAALSELHTALALAPASGLFRLGQGVILLAHGEITAAEAALQAALARDPRLAEAHNQLALIDLQRGDGAGARAELEQAVALDPGLIEAHVRLAQLLAPLGAREKALDHLREARRLAPTDERISHLIETIAAGVRIPGASRPR